MSNPVDQLHERARLAVEKALNLADEASSERWLGPAVNRYSPESCAADTARLLAVCAQAHAQAAMAALQVAEGMSSGQRKSGEDPPTCPFCRSTRRGVVVWQERAGQLGLWRCLGCDEEWRPEDPGWGSPDRPRVSEKSLEDTEEAILSCPICHHQTWTSIRSGTWIKCDHCGHEKKIED